MRRLYRSRDERMIAGVAGGIAHYLDIDPTLVRLAFVASTLAAGGIGLPAYVLLAIIVPLGPAPGVLPSEIERPAEVSAEEETRREAQEAQIAGFPR
jgi:phage shock protein C